MNREDAVDRLNALLAETIIPSGRGVEDFTAGKDGLRLHILRCHDWHSQTLEGNECFRLQITIASTEAIPLTGVKVFAFNAKTDVPEGESGVLSVSTTSPTEFMARVRLLPFGGSFCLQLGIIQESEE